MGTSDTGDPEKSKGGSGPGRIGAGRPPRPVEGRRRSEPRGALRRLSRAPVVPAVSAAPFSLPGSPGDSECPG
jgi:hypothetical protein